MTITNKSANKQCTIYIKKTKNQDYYNKEAKI